MPGEKIPQTEQRRKALLKQAVPVSLWAFALDAAGLAAPQKETQEETLKTYSDIFNKAQSYCPFLEWPKDRGHN